MNCVKLLVAMAVLLPASAPAAEKPAPSGCHWQSIPELKAHLAVPNGWRFEKKTVDNALVYEVRPAGKGFEKSHALFHLEVRLRTNPADVVNRARQFIEDLRAQAEEPKGIEEQRASTLTFFSCFVAFAPSSDASPRLTSALSSVANSRTGTIYTTRFDIPEDEIERIAPLGNGLYRELRLDDDI